MCCCFQKGMNLMPQEPTELIPKDLIRVETVLTRYPIHRLAKKGTIVIELSNTEAAFKWEVSYNSKHGQPGPLAYKVDTLIINRRVEEGDRPTPKLIKLGGLKEIISELGLKNHDTNILKKALHQNASAYITAKIRYKLKDGAERTSEFSNTRYGVAFTGEKLPDGREAEAVYIVLNDWYRDILDTAQTRPLDYDYLKELSPGAQRLYELLSFQIYGAIEGERKRAKLLYSEFCTFAPQARYSNFEQVKKQMYKLHLPHRRSGYIAAVYFQEIIDSKGQSDWEIYYTPGLKAKGEHTATKRKPRIKRGKQQKLPLPKTDESQAAHAAATPAPAESLTEEQEQFVDKLLGYGVSETEARKLVTTRLDACWQKIPAIPYLPESQGTQNRAGNVRAFIERDDWQLPAAYVEAQAKSQEVRHSQEKRAAIEECRLCDAQGRRFVVTEKYPRGAMKRCSHDPQTEAKYTDA